jgi:hypothetical protein
MKRTLLTPHGALLLLVAVLAGGGLAYAAIPSADGTIHGCFDKARGTLRIVDAEAIGGGRCSDSEAALSWNQKGPVGPAGPQGPVGAQGPGGPAGGFKGIRRVVAFGKFTNATSKNVTVNCAAGEVATGGGHQLVGKFDGRVVTRSFPVGGSPPTGWQAKARATVALGNWRVRAWAVCAQL